MSEELQDEVTSITSIYGEEALSRISQDPAIYSLVIPAQPSISIRIEFPTQYPDVPPSILGTQHIGDNVAKGDGAFLVDLLREITAEVYTPGAPCLFDLIEESNAKLHALGRDQSTAKDEEPQAAQADGQLSQPVQSSDQPINSDGNLQAPDELGEEPPWILSDVISEKKSVFIARAAPVKSVETAKQYLAHLLATDKKVAKATHNITAWRIRGENAVQYQDCDDDGETAAGGRVLHLLELMGVWDAMVVVTRWYGGVQLGPDRFRIINQTARDALVKAGLAPEAGGKDGNKKKGKK
ncbi:hypothetical protein D0869_06853 [Hortaea werneckii]|uniref:RWD domain-containing protein n=1 Tax=Hortaea werneckii TaxID=91943 RepID=A0A3M6WS43_HORWE|nr:UPF0029-domain-containing protein [Hortaea werneckii]KAI7584621.1 UPF0029-domain-containing protein [Hortaea werneckii]RMX81377.1 hypothetical protein D0869_06853 [Hortaea werneckii]RMY10343.1 hypothetical protein D0868_03747 [Hortaea werneckii]